MCADIVEGRGSLSYKFRLADPALPLAFLVHGRAGNFDVMWTFARCFGAGWNFIAPQAHLSDPLGGFSWWDAESPGRGVPEAAGIFEEFAAEAMERHGLVPPTRLALGFSQGGGLLAAHFQLHAKRFDGIGLLASFVPRMQAQMSAEKLRVSFFMSHGEHDDKVPLPTAERDHLYLQSLGLKTEFHVDPVKHKIGASGMRALKNWIAGFDRNPEFP